MTCTENSLWTSHDRQYSVASVYIINRVHATWHLTLSKNYCVWKTKIIKMNHCLVCVTLYISVTNYEYLKANTSWDNYIFNRNGAPRFCSTPVSRGFRFDIFSLYLHLSARSAQNTRCLLVMYSHWRSLNTSKKTQMSKHQMSWSLYYSYKTPHRLHLYCDRQYLY